MFQNFGVLQNHPNWIFDLPPGGLWILTEAFPVMLAVGSLIGTFYDFLGAL